MNQLRFQIGVPKAGSAAREAENSADAPLGSIRPRAGSAARDAEERKRAEPLQTQRGASVGMRAQGGRVVTAEEMRAASGRPPAAPQVSPEEKKAVVFERLAPTGTSVPGTQMVSTSSIAIPEQVEENASSGSLQTAAVRIKSLVQSLFSSGDSSSSS
ncbi:MAG: hypothetical protein ACRYF4_08500 [Janthinobacterium lividum]